MFYCSVPLPMSHWVWCRQNMKNDMLHDHKIYALCIPREILREISPNISRWHIARNINGDTLLDCPFCSNQTEDIERHNDALNVTCKLFEENINTQSRALLLVTVIAAVWFFWLLSNCWSKHMFCGGWQIRYFQRSVANISEMPQSLPFPPIAPQIERKWLRRYLVCLFCHI